ncbi:MAG: hypothetical protein GKC04_06720 [Methanomicrobiales archaeon]|nr:hypothetical protein [Methanomicrobiales archaeon]
MGVSTYLTGELLTSASLIVGGIVIALQIVGMPVPYTPVILLVMAVLVVIGVGMLIAADRDG